LTIDILILPVSPRLANVTLSHFTDEDMQHKDQIACPRIDRQSMAKLWTLNPRIPL